MTQNTTTFLLAILAIAAVCIIGYILWCREKRKRDQKLTIHLTEDEKLYVGLDAKADLLHVAGILIEGLGGRENVEDVIADGNRLKATIREYDKVKEDVLRTAHTGAILRPSKTAVHIIVGKQANEVANLMKQQLKDQ